MNTKYIKTLLLLMLAAMVIACATKKEENEGATAETAQKNWAGMDDYHMVMAEAFHPYKDSANLEPAKRTAADLKSSAESWASAALPEKVDNADMKEKLEDLKDESAVFAAMVNTSDDEAIGVQLTKLHDLFHSIQEAWYDEDAHSGHAH